MRGTKDISMYVAGMSRTDTDIFADVSSLAGLDAGWMLGLCDCF